MPDLADKLGAYASFDIFGFGKIVHVDMDTFYTSVEQRDDSSRKGKPVVAAWKGQRSVMHRLYEARRYGVRSAIPAIQEERLLPPDFPRYKAVSQAVRETSSDNRPDRAIVTR